MLWRDLREYLARLEELGDLKKVVGANWEEDIGGISEFMIERRGPALLFDEIPGYPKGYRVASNLFNTTKRTAIALGLSPDPPDDLGERWTKVMENLRPVPTKEVSSGPILENFMEAGDVDLYKFPVPKWHEMDGGRYIGTGDCVIQKDPDSGFVNVGAYRLAIHNEKICTIFIEDGRHGDLIRRKFWERGQKCPVAISIGQEPVLTALSGSGIYHSPYGVSEFEVAGYLHDSPYPIVKGQFTGLPMPANSEIVVEGVIPPPEEAMLPEGPFGEWTGYYAHGRRPETIVEVMAIYHRNDPIIFGAPPTRPINCKYSPNLGGDSIDAMWRLQKAGIPGIRRVVTLATPSMRAVALKQMYEGHVEDVIRILVPGGDQHMGNLIWILVDDDIDVTNVKEVLWAVSSRCLPKDGVQVIPGTAVWQLDPRMRPEERSSPDKEQGRKRYAAHNLVINACRPYDWINEFPPVCVNSPDLRQRIQKKWKDLFDPIRD